MERRLLESLERDERLDPIVLTFLFRRYRETGSANLAEPLGRGLAIALDRYADQSSFVDRAAWLTLFTDASAFSDDERLQLATKNLIVGLVDELERVVGSRYRPGEGLSGGTIADQVSAASALLTAYEATARLPYAMLAEELMQIAGRHIGEDVDFLVSCEAAHVFCRLAMLHADDAYRASAIVAPDANYRAEAERILTDLSSRACPDDVADARYALALAQYNDLQ